MPPLMIQSHQETETATGHSPYTVQQAYSTDE